MHTLTLEERDRRYKRIRTAMETGGATRIVFGDVFLDVHETLNIIAKEIIPELKY